VDEVVLHPYAVVAGHHDRRVRGAGRDAGLDDQAGLGPRLGSTLVRALRRRRRGAAGWQRPQGRAGQRRHPDREGAVAGQRLRDEREAVQDRRAVRPDRRPTAGTAGPADAGIGAGGGQHGEEHHQHGGDPAADQPAPDRPELRQFGA
jgi:hypothetical protein